MTERNLNGKRYSNLVRCSTTEQAETSIPDQLKLLNAFAAEHGMIHVVDADIVLEGVSGSVPGARTDIEQVIRRKRERNDFDVLLVQDMSRFTRRGVEHGMKLEFDLNAEGIELIFVADNLPEGDHQALVKSVVYYAARQHAKSIAFNTTRGGMSSLLEGRRGYSSMAPYGIDKLYLSPEGTELSVIRDLADGTQQMLDPTTSAIIQTYGRKEGNGPSPHHRKQRQERIAWIPGAEGAVRVINQIFRRKLINGWGAVRIIHELHSQGSRTSNGKFWSITAILKILANPIYIGLTIANRMTKSIYFHRSPSAPAPAKVNARELAGRKYPRVRYRPSAEWVVVEEPRLANFLDADIRDAARAMLMQELEKAQGLKSKPNRDRHIDSRYILKGVLHSKQGNHPLTGRSSKDRYGKQYRWYAISQPARLRTDDPALRGHISAESLEQAVLEVVREVLLQAPQLRSQIQNEIERQQNAVAADGDDIAKLKAEQEKLVEQIGFIIDELGTLGRAAARKKVEQLEGQLRLVNDRLAKAAAAVGGESADAAKAADAIIARLKDSAQMLQDAPPAALRRLLAVLVARMEIDMPTREIEVDLALPIWAAIDSGAYEKAISFDTKPFRWIGNEAMSPALPLGMYVCASPRHPICFYCRRRAA